MTKSKIKRKEPVAVLGATININMNIYDLLV